MQTEDRQFKSPPAAGDPLKRPAAMEQDFSLPDCFIAIGMCCPRRGSPEGEPAGSGSVPLRPDDLPCGQPGPEGHRCSVTAETVRSKTGYPAV